MTVQLQIGHIGLGGHIDAKLAAILQSAAGARAAEIRDNQTQVVIPQ